MDLIQQYIKIHQDKPGYGTGGTYFAKYIERLIEDSEPIKSILDFGCGKGHLVELFDFKYADKEVDGYDPAIPDFWHEKIIERKWDFVIATDVLEHFDPDKLHEELSLIERITGKCFFANISCRPATQKLGDGSNAHTCLMEPQRWLDTLALYFSSAAGGNALQLVNSKFNEANQNLIVFYRRGG